MYEPLHHKYRPQMFSQLVGQGAIADTLTNALQQNRIAPAYLFCGPRGTGKTSSARILAKSLNCLKVDSPTATPCGECDVCLSVSQGSSLDIVEIDAASNTGVDNIRELIERSQFAPVQCRYKVYVIDECHMLSTAAFNALLKTLEEPPERVVFVLATTDPQRVLPTIISRCQRFDFRRIPLPSMVDHLHYIAKKESIAISPSAIQLVAQISQGGLRDAESLLDQLSLQAEEISVESVWDLVGAVPERDLLDLVRAIAADDSTALLDRVRHLMDKGREPLIVLQSLVGFYRDLLIAKRAPEREDLVAITPPTWAEMTEFAQQLSASELLVSQQKLQTSEVQIKNTTQPRLWLEITLTGLLPSAIGAAADSSSPQLAVRATTSSVSASAAASPTATAPAPTIQSPQSKEQQTAIPSKIAPPPISAPKPSSPITPPPSAPAQTTTQTASATQPASIEPSISPKNKQTNVNSNTKHSSATQAVNSSAQNDNKTSLQSSTAQSTHQQPAQPPPEETTDVAFGSLSDLWNQLLAVLTPRGTQMLMAQQGVLLGFDGVGAKVGFRSASLQKMAQERVPNLEKAFEAIFKRPIRVSLEIVTPEEAPSKENDKSPPPPPTPPVLRARPSESPFQQPAKPAPQNQPQNQSPSYTSKATDSNQNLDKNIDQKNSNQNGTVESNASINNRASSLPSSVDLQNNSLNNTLPSSRPSRLDPPTDSIDFDQDQEKIKRFANFFNGEIVSLEEEKNRIDSKKSSEPKSSEPGPDVPF